MCITCALYTLRKAELAQQAHRTADGRWDCVAWVALF